MTAKMAGDEVLDGDCHLPANGSGSSGADPPKVVMGARSCPSAFGTEALRIPWKTAKDVVEGNPCLETCA